MTPGQTNGLVQLLIVYIVQCPQSVSCSPALPLVHKRVIGIYRQLWGIMRSIWGLSQIVVPQITIEDTLQIMLNTCSTIPYDALVARWHRPLIWVGFPVQWSGWTCQWCPSSKWATCSATMNCFWTLDQIVCLFGLYLWHSQYISVVPYYFA